MQTHAIVRVELVQETCWCGMPHAVPRGLVEKQKRDHRDGNEQTSIYCPLGHAYVIAGESQAEILEKKLQQERQRHDQTRADRDHKERQRRAAKGQVTRLKQRAAAGLCPCCNRTFQNLARHMETKHPDVTTNLRDEE